MGKTNVEKRSGFKPIHMVFLGFILVQVIVWYVSKTFIFNYPNFEPEEISVYVDTVVIATAMLYFPWMLPSIIGRNKKHAWRILWTNYLIGWIPFLWLWVLSLGIARDRD